MATAADVAVGIETDLSRVLVEKEGRSSQEMVGRLDENRFNLGKRSPTQRSNRSSRRGRRRRRRYCSSKTVNTNWFGWKWLGSQTQLHSRAILGVFRGGGSDQNYRDGTCLRPASKRPRVERKWHLAKHCEWRKSHKQV